MRIAFLSIALILLVLIMAAVAGVFLLHTQWFVKFAESKLTQAIGQEVDIGSIDIDPGQPVYVRVENISVANPPWASTPFMTSAETITAGIDVVELLSGDLVFTEIQSTSPLVHLEKSVNGKANWRTQDDSANGGGTPDEKGNDENAFDLPRVEKLSVKDGLLTYTDFKQNTSMRISLTSRGGTNGTETGLIADGDGIFRGQPLQVELQTGPPPELTATEENGFSITARFHSPDTSLLIEGTVDALVSPEAADLHVILKGEDLSRWNEAVEMEFASLPVYELTGHLLYADGVWALKPGTLTVENNHITGSFQIIPDANPLRIEGHLSSKSLNVAQIQNYFPDQPERPLAVKAAQFLNFLERKKLQLDLSYHADLIKTEALPVHNAEVALTLNDKILTVEKLSGSAAGMNIKADGRISADQEPAEGRIQVQFETAEVAGQESATEAGQTEIDAISELPGRLTGNVAVHMKGATVPLEGKSTPADGQDPAQRMQITSIDVPKFHIRYTDSSTNTNLLVRLEQEKLADAAILKADGQFHNKPIQASLKLPGLDQLTDPHLNPDRPQQIAANLYLPGTMASLVASVLPVWPPARMDVRFMAESQAPTATAALWDIKLPGIGEAAVTGSLTKRNSRWNIHEIKGRVGQSTIQGKAVIDTAEELRFEARLHSNLLNLAVLLPNDSDHSNSNTATSNARSSDAAETASKDFSIPQWVTKLNGQIGLDVQKLVLPNVSLTDISLLAAIDDGRLRIVPLSLKIGGGIIRTTAMLNLKTPALAGSLQTEIEEVDLDEAMQQVGREAAELGTVNGHLALQLPAADQSTNNSLTTESLLERVRLEEVRLLYDDPALRASSNLRVRADSLSSAIKVTGTVEYHDRPMDVTLSTGSLRQAFQDYTQMKVDAIFQINKTTVGIKGPVEHLFPLEHFSGTVTAEGPDPARLGDYLGIPLPRLPPYRVRAQVQREAKMANQQTFRFHELDGTVGDSDVAGTLRVSTGGERPMIFARLQSNKLDFDDLGGLVGAPPDPEETASSEQQAQAEELEEQNRILPDNPVNFTRLRETDADVTYKAKHVQANQFPLDDFFLDMVLENGHLQMTRLDFGVRGGTMAMELEVQAGQSPVQAKLNADFDKVKLSKLFKGSEMADDASGNMGGHATLWMRGESLAQWFASADGGLYLTMTGGQVDALLVELAGLDFIESAAVFVGTDSTVNIDCAYTDLQVRSGIVTIEPFLVDTKDTKFKGSGKIDLRQEQVNLTVKPYPKDFSLLSSRGPLHVTGTFKNPHFSVEPSFPLPEFGTADDSKRCRGMIEALRKARKIQEENRQEISRTSSDQ